MTGSKRSSVVAVLVDTSASLSIDEFSRACGVEIDIVREMVVEGVIEPCGDDRGSWRFSRETLVRAQCAIRLVDDLHVNWPGAALALDLLERLEEFER